MNYIFLDVESFFDKERGFDLKSLSMTEYIRDKRFRMHGFAVKKDDGPIIWQTGVINIKNDVDWKNAALIGHNVKFDGAVLKWRFGIDPALYIDTKALARAILGPYIAGYSLDEVGRYLGLSPKGSILAAYSGKKDLTDQEEAVLAEYCMNDVAICYGIWKKLWPQFPVSQHKALDWTVRTFINPQLRLDIQCLTRMVENEKARREAAIQATGLDKSVLSSNKQFAELVQRTCGAVPTKISKRTGKEVPALSVSDPGFLNLKESQPVLYAGRVAAKSTIIETRGENLINVGKTGLWPFDVGFSGAVQTHRYSGGDGAGGNPQNFPKNSDIKRSVVAHPEGSVCVVGDFAAIELRINAWLAKEQWLMELLHNGEDVYSNFASKIYKRKVTKEDKKERQFGKCSELGLGYGMGKEKFQNTVRAQVGETITLDFAKEIVWLYRDTHPKIKNLWTLAENLIPMMMSGQRNKVFFAPFLEVEKNAIVLPSGLKIMYPNLRKDGRQWVYDRYYKKNEVSPESLYGGKVVENICQALAGEICKEAIDEALAVGLDVVAQIHDEIIVIAPEKIASRVQNMLHLIMSKSPNWWPSLSLSAEVGIGPSWKDAKR